MIDPEDEEERVTKPKKMTKPNSNNMKPMETID
jgi:hypothetical protein